MSLYTTMAKTVCLLSHAEAKRLTEQGRRPACHAHQHIPEKEADKLIADRDAKEITVYRLVVVNGVEKRLRDGERRRITISDGRTWVKRYWRSALCQQAMGPGEPVMQLVRG